MTELITLAIDGQSATVAAGTTVIAAMAILQAENDAAGRAPWSPASAGAGATITRRSVTGMLRGPVCGMGVCQECRVMIDGRAHQLACQTLCASGMQVLTALAEGAA
jgi:predicted molibdopterin-dependent oxidoreductase YjgC